MLSPFSSTHFSLSLSSPPAVLPSGHSLQLLTETGYVANAEKIKQTSTTKDKQHTSLIITYILHGERLHGEHAKTQSHNAKKKQKSSIITLISLWVRFIFFLQLCFLLFFYCLPLIYFLCGDTRLELGDWGIWSIPLAGWGGLKKAAGVREEMFPASCWGMAGGTET